MDAKVKVKNLDGLGGEIRTPDAITALAPKASDLPD